MEAQTPTPRKINPERGAAMLVVASLLLALLAGGSAMLLLQVQSSRTAGLVKTAKSSLYCAEAGLAAASDLLITNVTIWPALLDLPTNNNPPWYPVTGDIDNPPDGVTDFVVTVRDNDDEISPTLNDKYLDIDARIFIVSRCVKYPDSPREMVQLVQYGGGGHVYQNQSGYGSGNTGNRNE